MLTTIPFSGFYNSMWDAALDDEAEAANYPEDVDWTKVRTTIARDYTHHFSNALGVKLDFVELKSPREYNFETDRIYVEISFDDAFFLLCESSDDDYSEFTRLIKERCTSRSGFLSFYSNNLDDWFSKGLKNWDHNEVGILVEAVADIREVNEEEIFGIMLCNGSIHNAFWAGAAS